MLSYLPPLPPAYVQHVKDECFGTLQGKVYRDAYNDFIDASDGIKESDLTVFMDNDYWLINVKCTIDSDGNKKIEHVYITGG